MVRSETHDVSIGQRRYTNVAPKKRATFAHVPQHSLVVGPTTMGKENGRIRFATFQRGNTHREVVPI